MRIYLLLLTPADGRLSIEVRLPIAHDLRGDPTLPRQAETGSDFLFRKEMLPCEHVKWRKRKRSGTANLIVVSPICCCCSEVSWP